MIGCDFYGIHLTEELLGVISKYFVSQISTSEKQRYYNVSFLSHAMSKSSTSLSEGWSLYSLWIISYSYLKCSYYFPYTHQLKKKKKLYPLINIKRVVLGYKLSTSGSISKNEQTTFCILELEM